jgi:hypothetical protein
MGPLCSTFRFENLRSPKNTSFFMISGSNFFFKNSFVKKVLCNFLVQTLFFDPQNMKKPPSNVAHNRPPTFFINTGPIAQTAQKQKSCIPKSPLMQDWVFRLGTRPIFHKSCFSMYF